MDDLKFKITRKIDCCENINEIVGILTKYYDKLSMMDNKNDISKYASFYENQNIDTIVRIIEFGSTVIEHGKKGYKAYCQIITMQLKR